MNRTEIESWYRRLQTQFAAGITAVDGEQGFSSDVWDRSDGGGGDTRMLIGGPNIEKAAVNFSAVWGATPPRLSEQLASQSDHFYATGVSIIVHPRNPYAPTFHANIRYFETDSGHSWFGGGADLTPHYIYPEDAQHFHHVLRRVCERHDIADHAAWKQACDEYFFLRHRSEARGIGGIFFDRLSTRLDEVWAFQQDLGNDLLEAYVPILERRIDTPYGTRERIWREVRRGRYVEFNLVWDRGTRFGLETGGRVEAILGSLPPRARWEYEFEPEPDSPEAELLDVLREAPRSWL